MGSGRPRIGLAQTGTADRHGRIGVQSTQTGKRMLSTTSPARAGYGEKVIRHPGKLPIHLVGRRVAGFAIPQVFECETEQLRYSEMTGIQTPLEIGIPPRRPAAEVGASAVRRNVALNRPTGGFQCLRPRAKGWPYLQLHPPRPQRLPRSPLPTVIAKLCH